jgi:hypothetical protein
MRITIDLAIDPALVPAALAEIRREGAQRRKLYPGWIEAGKLAPATAQRRLLALADAYRAVEAVATAVAPLIEARREAAEAETAGSGQSAVGSEEARG